MGKISLKEMNDHKVEKMESNDLKRDNDMREFELMAKYNQLSDFILTKLHGKFECEIPKETFMEKVFKKEGKEYSEAHEDGYGKDENLHIQLKIVPSSKLYRSELGPETEIASIFPPNHAFHWSIDYGRLPFCSDMVHPSSDPNDYEFNSSIDFDDRLESLEKGSRDRWVEKNADKFKSIEDAGDYYDKHWYLLTDVDYYKENLIRTSRGEKIQEDQSNAVYGRIVHPDWSESKTKEIFYTKPRAVLTVNGKEVELLPGELRKKMIVEFTKDQYETTKPAEFTKDHDEAMGRQSLTNRQADNLMGLVFRQAQQTIDRSALTNSDIIRQYQHEEKKVDDKWDIEDASDHKDFIDEEERNDENDFLQIEIDNNDMLEKNEIRQENADEYKRIYEQDDYDER